MWRKLLVAIVFIITCGSVQASTLKQYDSALAVLQQRLADDAQALDDGDSVTGTLPGPLAQRLLKGINRVRCANGVVFDVDTSGLIVDVKAADVVKPDADRETAYDGLEQRIEFLRSEIQAEGTVKAGPAASRDRARKILAGTEFGADPIPPPTWIERQDKALEDWLDRVLKKLFGKKTTNNMTVPSWWRYVLYVLAGLFFATILALIVYLIVQVAGRRGARVMVRPLSTSEEAFVEARDTNSILGMAEKHAKSGDYRAAFRLVYLATLVALDTGGVLRFDRSKTNWEYVRSLRRSGRHDLFKALAPLTRDFDRVWYGQTQAGPEEYRRAVAEYERLTTSLSGPAASGSR